MNILVKELKNEMNKQKEQQKVTSFYKYKLNDPYNVDHNIGFTPKYNLKVWDKPISNYNDHLIYIYKNWLLLVVLLVYSFHL